MSNDSKYYEDLKRYSNTLIEFSSIASREYKKISLSDVKKMLMNIPEIKMLYDQLEETKAYIKNNSPTKEFKEQLEKMEDILGGILEIYCYFYFAEGILTASGKEGENI